MNPSSILHALQKSPLGPQSRPDNSTAPPPYTPNTTTIDPLTTPDFDSSSSDSEDDPLPTITLTLDLSTHLTGSNNRIALPPLPTINTLLPSILGPLRAAGISELGGLSISVNAGMTVHGDGNQVVAAVGMGVERPGVVRCVGVRGGGEGSVSAAPTAAAVPAAVGGAVAAGSATVDAVAGAAGMRRKRAAEDEADGTGEAKASHNGVDERSVKRAKHSDDRKA